MKGSFSLNESDSSITSLNLVVAGVHTLRQLNGGLEHQMEVIEDCRIS